MSAALDPDRLSLVERWSLRIHGAGSPRHAWCMAAARALLDGEPLPEHGRRGTAFAVRSTAEARAETIGRILKAES